MKWIVLVVSIVTLQGQAFAALALRWTCTGIDSPKVEIFRDDLSYKVYLRIASLNSNMLLAKVSGGGRFPWVYEASFPGNTIHFERSLHMLYPCGPDRKVCHPGYLSINSNPIIENYCFMSDDSSNESF